MRAPSLRLLFAALSPLLVLGAAAPRLLRPLPTQTSAVAAEMDARLASAEPEVVMIGNSLLDAGVDPAAVAGALGLPEEKVQILWSPGAPSYTWFVMLKNRVYANGHRPRLVIMTGALPKYFVASAGETESDRQGLIDQSGAHEPEIEDKLLGRGRSSALLRRFETHAAALREGLADGIRRGTAGLLFGEGAGPLAERGEQAWRAASAAVFDAEGAVDQALHQRLMPVAEVAGGGEGRKVRSYEGSLLPEIISLAEAHDTRLIFLRVPCSPAQMKEEPASDQAMLVDLLRAVNASESTSFLDLTDVTLPLGSFVDQCHMNKGGKARFSEALAAALPALDPLGDAPFAAVPLPLALPFEAERSGPGPILPQPILARGDGPCQLTADLGELAILSDSALAARLVRAPSPLRVLQEGEPLSPVTGRGAVGETCSGQVRFRSRKVQIAPRGDADALDMADVSLALDRSLPAPDDRDAVWWIYPSTRLDLRFPALPEDAGALRFDLWIEPLTDDPARGLTAQLDDQPVALVPEGRLLRASGALAAPRGAVTLAISASAGAPYALVRRLRVSDGDRAADLIGDEEAVAPATLSALRFPGVQVEPAQPAFSRPLPATSPQPVATLELPDLAFLSLDNIQKHLNCGTCSPLVVREDGEELPLPRLALRRVRAAMPGSYAFVGGELRYTARREGELVSDARAYSLGLRAERAVAWGRWVYPGDRQDLSSASPTLGALSEGRWDLVLRGAPFGPGEAPVLLRVLAGEEVVARGRITPDALLGGEIRVPLPADALQGVKKLTVRLVSEEDSPFLLLWGMDLRERAAGDSALALDAG